MKFGIGVIGATGYIGMPYREEIRAATEDATIIALCARRRDLLEAAQQQDGAQLITDDWRAVVDHPDVNLVIVATPDALHYEPVLECARQGKHMVCEKPVGVNAKQAHDMWSAYQTTKLGHFVPFWTRYVPLFMRTRELVQSGMLGEIRTVIYRWHNPRPTAMPFTWRDDADLSAGGSVADVGSHAYDTMRWLLDQEVVRVLAHADVITDAKPDLGDVNLDEALTWSETHSADAHAKVRRGTAYDYAAISYEWQNGAVGSLILSHASYVRKGLAPELELHGTDASLAVNRITGQMMIARSGNDVEILETVDNPGFGNRFAQYVFPAVRAQNAGAECDHPDLQDGWRVQVFTDAVVKSAQRGTWVEAL